ncbi:MAG: hypothetical protein GX594_13440 [Pirellulaceae bacterium]|nr:hypothetical protein [Pirellulaceae bacterium]
MYSPGSDRAAEVWRQRYAIRGVESLHLYRAMAWLGGAAGLRGMRAKQFSSRHRVGGSRATAGQRSATQSVAKGRPL